MSTTTSGSARRGLPPQVPARPRGRVPVCEDCGIAEVALYCEGCGQELCRSCWADGDNAFCGGCRRRSWEDIGPEVGLLLADEPSLSSLTGPRAVS